MHLPIADGASRCAISWLWLFLGGLYVLQAGSFSAYADADRRRAELGMHGIESQIQRVMIDDKTYHRVRIGPTSDLEELNMLRSQRLVRQNPFTNVNDKNPRSSVPAPPSAEEAFRMSLNYAQLKNNLRPTGFSFEVDDVDPLMYDF